ncbi:MAG: energy transducer TonB [Burkholderiales bacterium]|nr:energy transducer TonB [Burkholderiales bacterium]
MSISIAYPYRATHASSRFFGLGLVIAVHVLVVWMLVSGTAQKGLKFLKKPMEAVVIQEVIIPPLPPIPLPPPPKEVRPPQPNAPRVETPLPFVPVPEVAAQTQSAPPTMAANPAPPPAPPVIAPAPAPVVESRMAHIASLEGEYILKVRTMLHSTKRYPTGRQASQQRPQGKVKLWFTLSRHGVLLDVGVLESSNSNLLDDAAIATVRRGSYEPFPPDTWTGEELHKFSAEIAFTPVSS